MEDPSKLLKISEMAALHGVSRQTLILYDKNGLLKPAFVSDTGYRYYSVDQIPRLRLVCLLKAMGVPLVRIRAYLEDCSAEGMATLLRECAAQVDEELRRLERQREGLEQLAQTFRTVTSSEWRENEPFVRRLPERTVLFAPYPQHEMDHKRLHLTLMDAWGSLLDAGEFPTMGFGSLLHAEVATGEHPLAGAGSIVFVPHAMDVGAREAVVLPEGEYACMYKRAMPYDVGPVRQLLAWMSDQGLCAAGPVVDRCLLDSIFYGPQLTADLCCLEVLLA